ncbi:MAG TPA: hypothetical protein VE684_16285, partial [Crenalkalicoccus sp.]|nr:hypothetical protein [Crenalkalicoccus sp.]
MVELLEERRPPGQVPGGAPQPGAAAEVETRLARLDPDGVVLLEVPCAAPPPAGVATLLIGGEALPPPTAALVLEAGGTPRLLFACRDPEGRLRPGASCELWRGEAPRPVARFTLGPAATAA